MSDERIGWGILATGGIADRFVRDLQDAGLHVAAVGSRTPERAQAFADEHGIPSAHGSWADLATDPTVDVVYVATPHPAHLEAASLMLEHGKHVLVEKPFTLNEPGARELQDLAAARGLVALEAMWTRWLPHMLEIHELLDAGAIGEPQLLIVDHTQPLPTDPDHRLNDPALGGGALLDLGVYPISFAVDLFGEPEDVLTASVPTSTGVDQRVSGTLVHAGGVHTVFSTASNLAGPNRASIVGTGGSIDIDAVWYAPTSYTVLDADRNVVRTGAPAVSGRGMQYEAFEAERLIREGLTESPRMTAESTRAVMRTMDRIRQATGLTYPEETAPGEPAR